jgi:ribosomal protein L11 methylase PrmA
VAAEGLGANDSADLIAVNVEIAHINAAHDLLHPIINAAVKPESEAIAAGVYILNHTIQIARVVAGQMQYGSEDLLVQVRDSAYR